MRRLNCILMVVAVIAISGCGMTRTVSDTSKSFDRFGCLARDFKGEPPCEEEAI